MEFLFKFAVFRTDFGEHLLETHVCPSSSAAACGLQRSMSARGSELSVLSASFVSFAGCSEAEEVDSLVEKFDIEPFSDLSAK